MLLSIVVFVVTVLCSSSVFSQACVQVSARLANVSCGAVAAFDLVYRSLSVLWFTLSLTLVSSCRKVVIGLWATRIPTLSPVITKETTDPTRRTPDRQLLRWRQYHPSRVPQKPSHESYNHLVSALPTNR